MGARGGVPGGGKMGSGEVGKGRLCGPLSLAWESGAGARTRRQAASPGPWSRAVFCFPIVLGGRCWGAQHPPHAPGPCRPGLPCPVAAARRPGAYSRARCRTDGAARQTGDAPQWSAGHQRGAVPTAGRRPTAGAPPNSRGGAPTERPTRPAAGGGGASARTNDTGGPRVKRVEKVAERERRGNEKIRRQTTLDKEKKSTAGGAPAHRGGALPPPIPAPPDNPA